MLRSMLIVLGTLVAVVAIVAGLIAFAMHRLNNARRAADADFHPALSAEPIAATQPADDSSEASPPPPLNSIELWAADAVPHGSVRLGTFGGDHQRADQPEKNEKAAARKRKQEAMGGHPVNTYLTDFHTPDDSVEWTLDVPKAGKYEVDLTYACPRERTARFVIKLCDQELNTTIAGERGPNSFRVTAIGTLMLPLGKTTLTLHPVREDKKGRTFLNLRCIQIIPAM